ncbi:MAG TPA: hypothetical protein VFO98_10470 [Marmoricola sp.]|nr:hypothetical protein [Marmoricola sp.]
MNQRNRQLGPETLGRLTLDTEPWLSCDDCFDQVDQYVERVFGRGPVGMPAMAAHLAGCPACAEEAGTLVLLAAEDAGTDPGPALDRLFGPVRR